MPTTKKPSATGKFRQAELTTPFGKIPLTKLATYGLTVVV